MLAKGNFTILNVKAIYDLLNEMYIDQKSSKKRKKKEDIFKFVL